MLSFRALVRTCPVRLQAAALCSDHNHPLVLNMVVLCADRLVGSAEARASSTAHSSHQHRMATQPEQAYNLCLSEMRHYQDDDTMVLVLSQRAGEVQEAEYPVPLEQDTSEILDAEGA